MSAKYGLKSPTTQAGRRFEFRIDTASTDSRDQQQSQTGRNDASISSADRHQRDHDQGQTSQDGPVPGPIVTDSSSGLSGLVEEDVLLPCRDLDSTVHTLTVDQIDVPVLDSLTMLPVSNERKQFRRQVTSTDSDVPSMASVIPAKLAQRLGGCTVVDWFFGQRHQLQIERPLARRKTERVVHLFTSK